MRSLEPVCFLLWKICLKQAPMRCPSRLQQGGQCARRLAEPTAEGGSGLLVRTLSLLLLVAPEFLWTSPHQITGHSEDLFLQNAGVFVTHVEGQRCLPGNQA